MTLVPMTTGALAAAAMETQRRFLLLDSELHGPRAAEFDGVTVAPTGLLDAQWNVAWIGTVPDDPHEAAARVRRYFADPPLPYCVWAAEGLDPDGSPLAVALASTGHRRLLRLTVMAIALGPSEPVPPEPVPTEPVPTEPVPTDAGPEGTLIVESAAMARPEEIAAFSSRCFTQEPHEWIAYLGPRRNDPRITEVLALTDVGHPRGRIVGAVNLVRLGEGVRLHNLGTLPEWRGQGVARALLSRALRVAAAEGHSHATLIPSSQGRPVYARTGFTEVSAVTVWLP